MSKERIGTIHVGNKLWEERSIQFAAYKDFEIQAVPDQFPDSGEWRVNICIIHHGENEMQFRQFTAANSFKTRDEAVAHCFNFGKQVIEGKIENCTVDGL